ncbi:hypothetical protein SAMN02799626_01822 [Caulobacter sp. UNC279MFTsu5.1]|nr:hypothetical protein SAMN02799626_01822 [Caulobacter sp. UNC279MFTsu5.1]
MSPIRQFMAWACALPLIGAMICADATMASTPVLTWDGAKRLGVQCLVDPDRTPDRRRLQAALCDRVRVLAADKAPIPVVLLAPGDPGLIAADTAVLLFHANVQPADGGAGSAPLLVFSLRVFRATAAPSELFGAAPRATRLPAKGTNPTPQFDAAVNAALAETLPWRSRPAP